MAFQTHLLPVLNDNYIFLIHDPLLNTVVVVDPAVAAPVLGFLNARGARLTAIFITHHHWDHVGGIVDLLTYFPEAMVYASAHDQGRIPGQTVALRAGDQVEFAGLSANILFVPGHTQGHIAYHFPGDLFCGDTLFGGGCGRLKEGTATQLLNSLDHIRLLPAQTRVWCAHEYTLSNLSFALTVDPDNDQLQERYAQVQHQRRLGQPTIPTSLALEQQTNPFLRIDEPALQKRFGTVRSLAFTQLRQLKDQF